MRPWPALIPLLAFAVVLGGDPVDAFARAAPAPAATPGAVEGAALQIVVAELAPDRVAEVGVTRTTYAPGGALRAAAGAGPFLLVVESGALVVRPVEGGPPPMILPPGSDAEAGTPATAVVGEDRSLEAGAALLLPAGGAAEIRNDGASPAVALDLLAAADVRFEGETGISRVLLARREATLPAPPVEVSLARTTIPPGSRLPLPPPPAETVVATVDRAQTFLLTGQSFNRGKTPMAVYVLTIAPAAAGEATPTA